MFAMTIGAADSLRNDPTEIRDQLLKAKPLGTSIDEVDIWPRTEKRLNSTVSKTSGFLKQQQPGSSVVGKMSIKADLGVYKTWFFFTTSVVAFWGFDEKGQLIEVWVWKTTDAI